MPAKRDRKKEIVAAAVKEVRQGGAAATINGGGGDSSSSGTVGVESIQDEDGNLYAMVDISTVNGPDVIAP